MMKLSIVLAVMALLSVVVSGQLSSTRYKPEARYEREMRKSFKAQDELDECRAAAARSGENLHDLECFHAAMTIFPHNASWAKQYAALAMMTAQRKLADEYFNMSAQMTLEHQAFKGFDTSPDWTPEVMLKLYRRREPEGAMELAKVWSQHLQMSQSLQTAADILEKYVVPMDHLEEAIMVYRNIGNLGRVVELKHEVLRFQAAARRERLKKSARKVNPNSRVLSEAVILGEELATSAESLIVQWLSAPLTVTPEGAEESNHLTKELCGVPFPRKDEYSLTDVVTHLAVCTMKWGKYKGLAGKDGGEAALRKPYGVMLRTVAHQLATFNSEYLLKVVLELAPDLIHVKDNFGRTPLHASVAHQQPKTTKLLLKLGGAKLLNEKDAGDISPLKMACSAPTYTKMGRVKESAKPTPSFRQQFESFVTELDLAKARDSKSTVCSHIPQQDIVHDEFDDENEELYVEGGGYQGANQRFEEEECDFDVRTADSISHHELVGRYLHTSRPVVLRGAIVDSTVKALKKKNLRSNPDLASVRLRRESYPTSEHYGTPMEKIQNITDFLKNTTRTFGTIEMSKAHTLHHLLNFLPHKLIPPQNGYVTPGDSMPLFVLSGKNARTNYVTRIQHYFYANVYGVQDWRLTPPLHAKTTRAKAEFSSGANVGDDVGKLKCRLQSGDMIVVPGLWSAAWKSRSEAAGYLTRFVWK